MLPLNCQMHAKVRSVSWLRQMTETAPHFFLEVDLDVYAVQLFSRCPNAQKWVWMFMLYGCSACNDVSKCSEVGVDVYAVQLFSR